MVVFSVYGHLHIVYLILLYVWVLFVRLDRLSHATEWTCNSTHCGLVRTYGNRSQPTLVQVMAWCHQPLHEPMTSNNYSLELKYEFWDNCLLNIICMGSQIYYNNITWALWHLNSLAAWLFVKQLGEACRNKNIKALHEFGKTFPFWWCHLAMSLPLIMLIPQAMNIPAISLNEKMWFSFIKFLLNMTSLRS